MTHAKGNVRNVLKIAVKRLLKSCGKRPGLPRFSRMALHFYSGIGPNGPQGFKLRSRH